MKIKHIILLAGVAAFSSCSTAYRSGQTPDDVYYSPAPQENTYVSNVSGKDQDSYYSTNNDNSYYGNNEDNDIRAGINNPIYRSPLTLSMGFGYNPYSFNPYNSFNNYYGYNNFGYSPYGMKGLYNPYYDDLGYGGLGMGYSPYYSPYSSLGFGYSPYSSYGYGYSPYSSPILFSTKSVNTNTGARKYNLNAYNNGRINTGTRVNDQPIRTETTQPNRGTGVGNVIRRVFTPSERRNTYTTPNNTRRTYNNNNERTYNNNRNDNYQTPQRSFTPSTSTQSSAPASSPSSSRSSAPVRSFGR
ncbi:MAG: hypothetical protein ABI374_01970 [Ginsengibacter sp.]